MFVISFVATALIGAGTLVLLVALHELQNLLGILPGGQIVQRWHTMRALIIFFVMGYIGYGLAFSNTQTTVLHLIVPTVFLFGACFVWLTMKLSLQTAKDLRHIATLERESITDALTGVPNRRYFDRQLEDEFEIAKRYGTPLSLLVIDIDHFKRFNDQHGHAAGDEVLIEVARFLMHEKRSSDLLARYGGEEFVVIGRNAELAHAERVAERFVERLRGADIKLGRSSEGMQTPVNVTISVGVASLTDAIESGEKLFSAADTALYEAKNAGRDRWCSA